MVFLFLFFGVVIMGWCSGVLTVNDLTSHNNPCVGAMFE